MGKPKGATRRVATIALVLGLAAATAPLAQAAQRGQAGQGSLTAAQEAALERLLPGARATFDPKLGFVTGLIRDGGYLSGADARHPNDIALGFLKTMAPVFGIDAADLSSLYVSYSYPTKHNGVWHVFVHQRTGGLELYGSSINFTIDAQGRIVNLGGRYLPGAAAANQRRLSADDAVRAAADQPNAVLVAKERAEASPYRTVFANSIARGLASPTDITAELVAFPNLDTGAARVAWKTIVETDSKHWYETVVDASNGDVLFQENYYRHSGAEGRVFTTDDPDGATRSVVSFTGWVTDRTTSGNNTNTFQDLDGDNASDYQPTTPASGDPGHQHFDYAFTDAYQTSGGTDVTTDRDATVTQLFYWTNFTHDYLYGLGFDEAARNFQVDNFGRGGTGGDPVLAEANDNYDNGDRNNANFATPADGTSPRMQMYTFEPTTFFGTTKFRDGTLDADLIVHEYGHGLSERLIDNGTNLGGVQTGAMGEAWGDFYAISIFNDPVWSEYASDLDDGLRNVRYDDSDWMYSDLCNTNGFGISGCEVHNDGEIWATVLWDMRQKLIARHGFATGKAVAEQVVIDGIKGTGVDASFLQARDAILAADQTNSGGANRCLIWSAFAAREMGFSAASSGNGSSVTPATDGPANCVPTASAGGPYNGAEGSTITLTSAASTDPDGQPLSTAWDLDNDGQFDDGATPSIGFSTGQDGVFTVGVEVTDGDGFKDTATAVVTVTNAAPTVDVPAIPAADEGSLVTANVSAVDPGWLDVLEATVDWGDGTSSLVGGSQESVPPDATYSGQATHVYGDNGVYNVTFCVADDDTSTCSTEPVTVNNVAPSVVLDPAQLNDLVEGGLLPTGGEFTDPGFNDVYTYEVAWGDGTSAAGIPTMTADGPPVDRGTVGSVKQYGDNGSFPVTVTVRDDDGGVDSESFQVNVSNVVPTAEIDTTLATAVNGTPTIVASMGDVVPVNARSQDPGSDDLLLRWIWGDGSPDAARTSRVNSPAADPTPSPTVQPRDVLDPQAHTFGAACMYTVGFSSTDDDGGAASDSVSVIVQGLSAIPRGAGYWKHQYGGVGLIDHSTSTLDCYLAITQYTSTIFSEARNVSTRAAAHDLLFSKPGDSDVNKLDREILTAWLNFANGSLDWGQLVDTNADGLPDTAFSTVVAAAETVRLNPASTARDLDRQRQILQRINR